MPNEGKLILASASPRRRELLALLLPDFEIAPSRAAEKTEGEGRALARENALIKGLEVASRYPGRYILSSDTLVLLDGESLGKPKSEREAADMLQKLSGKWHSVYTAVCLLLPGGRILESQSDTRVRFGAMTQSDIRYYISTGEPMDKAGAYALQGVGGRYIERVEGSPSGVIGLPLYETRALLQSAGLLEYH